MTKEKTASYRKTKKTCKFCGIAYFVYYECFKH